MDSIRWERHGLAVACVKKLEHSNRSCTEYKSTLMEQLER